MPSNKSIGARRILAYATLCAIWGSTWLAIRILVKDVPPFHAAGLRFVIAACLLLGVAAAKGLKFPQGVREWRTEIILGLTMMALPYGLLFWAEQTVTSSMTAVVFSSMPLMVASLTPWMTGKPVPQSAIFSMMIGIGGIAVLIHAGLNTSASTLTGGIAVLLAVFFSAWSALYAKRESLKVSSLVSSGVQLAIGAVSLIAASVFAERGQASHWTRSAILALIFLATFGSAVAFAVYYWLLRHLHPYQLSTISLIIPLVAITEGALFLNEPVTGTMMTASLVVIAAVGYVLRADRRKAPLANAASVESPLMEGKSQ